MSEMGAWLFLGEQGETPLVTTPNTGRGVEELSVIVTPDHDRGDDTGDVSGREC